MNNVVIAPELFTAREGMRRFNAKCHCGTCTSVLAARTNEFVRKDSGLYQVAVTPNGTPLTYDNGAVLLPCRGCGHVRRARPVLGKYRADRACDARCMSAKGHSCECQCGGKNHGAGHEHD